MITIKVGNEPEEVDVSISSGRGIGELVVDLANGVQAASGLIAQHHRVDPEIVWAALQAAVVLLKSEWEYEEMEAVK